MDTQEGQTTTITRQAEEQEEEQGPNFLQTLVNQDTLTNQQVVGIVTDLFTAGIDSVSIHLKVAIAIKSKNLNHLPFNFWQLLHEAVIFTSTCKLLRS